MLGQSPPFEVLFTIAKQTVLRCICEERPQECIHERANGDHSMYNYAYRISSQEMKATHFCCTHNTIIVLRLV